MEARLGRKYVKSEKEVTKDKIEDFNRLANAFQIYNLKGEKSQLDKIKILEKAEEIDPDKFAKKNRIHVLDLGDDGVLPIYSLPTKTHSITRQYDENGDLISPYYESIQDLYKSARDIVKAKDQLKNRVFPMGPLATSSDSKFRRYIYGESNDALNKTDMGILERSVRERENQPSGAFKISDERAEREDHIDEEFITQNKLARTLEKIQNTETAEERAERLADELPSNNTIADIQDLDTDMDEETRQEELEEDIPENRTIEDLPTEDESNEPQLTADRRKKIENRLARFYEAYTNNLRDYNMQNRRSDYSDYPYRSKYQFLQELGGSNIIDAAYDSLELNELNDLIIGDPNIQTLIEDKIIFDALDVRKMINNVDIENDDEVEKAFNSLKYVSKEFNKAAEIIENSDEWEDKEIMQDYLFYLAKPAEFYDNATTSSSAPNKLETITLLKSMINEDEEIPHPKIKNYKKIVNDPNQGMNTKYNYKGAKVKKKNQSNKSKTPMSKFFNNLAAIDAGNDNKSLINETIKMVDDLQRLGVISKKDHDTIVKSIIRHR